MLAAPARAWNSCTPIFADHGDGVPHAQPRSQSAYANTLGAQMLAGGKRDKLGSIAYRGPHCGQGDHRVARRGNSSCCWRCATVEVDNWGNQGSKGLHPGGLSRHISLTVPARFRMTCYQHAAVVLRACRRCGAQGLAACYSTVRGKALQGGRQHGPPPAPASARHERRGGGPRSPLGASAVLARGPAASQGAVAPADQAAPDAQDRRGPSVGRCGLPAVSRWPGDQRAAGRCPLAGAELGALRGQVRGEPAARRPTPCAL